MRFDHLNQHSESAAEYISRTNTHTVIMNQLPENSCLNTAQLESSIGIETTGAPGSGVPLCFLYALFMIHHTSPCL